MSAQVTPKKTLRIGIMLDNVQLMDIMGIDLFANLSRDYFNFVRDEAPAEFKPVIAAFERHALDIEYFYLAPTKEPTTTTARFTYLPTVTYDECPRDLDILLIGGPLPSYRPPQADRFMKEAWTKTRVVLTTCTGAMWLASTGLVDGKKCTTNRGFLSVAKASHPNVDWQDQRWVVDEKPYEGSEGKGELWTSGAAGAGLEMIAQYCLQTWDKDFVNFTVQPVDFKLDVGQFYPA